MTVRAAASLAGERTTLGEAGTRWFRISLAVGIVGLAAAFAMAALAPGGWDRFYPSYLASYVFFLTLALGMLFFVLLQHLTRAGWSVSVRRIAEAFAANALLPMAILVAPILFGLRRLYPWTDGAAVAADPALAAKVAWLNVPFFLARTVCYFLVWSILAVWFHRSSTRQDRTGDPRITSRLETTSTAAMILFAFSVTFFAFDYLMSLTPRWYSTIFGVYLFAGCVVSAFALLIVAARAVQAAGALRSAITVEHYHDLGKLVFAFTIFWAYIGFSQYMLMWYANLPEETIWYAARQAGSWKAWSFLLLFGHFLAPFLVLMSRHAKRRRGLLLAGALWMLAMQWADIYWLVMPAKSPGVVPISPMDVATFVGVGGLFFAAAARRLAAHALIPDHDPRLAESLGFENI